MKGNIHMPNWLTSLGSELSTTLGTVGSAITPDALTKALQSVFAGKYATIITELQSMKGLGPMGPAAQLNQSIAVIEQQLVPLTPPQAESGFLSGLSGLIGKPDAESAEQWDTLTASAISDLQNAS
jgi:hypothetical protein